MTAVKPFNKEIKILTSLRMAAATWVVFYHLTHFTTCAALADFPLVSSGYLGVDFFFVLSGFVLTHVYQPQITAGKFDYWAFVAKRFARIYPMHLAMLVVFVVIGALAAKGRIPIDAWLGGISFKGEDFGVLYRAFIANLTLIHAWGSTSELHFNLPSWSISAEWFAYLMFPVFVLLRRLPPHGEGAKLAVVIALFVLLSLAFQAVLHGELTRLTWNLGILRIFPEFLIGMSLHRLGEKWSAGVRGSLAGFLGSFALVIASVMAGGLLPHLAIPMATLAVIGLGGLVFFGADADRYGGLRSLSGDFLVYLGEISYSIYMVHLAVGIVIFGVLFPAWRPADFLSALATVIGALVVITLTSACTYRFIEVPSRDWIVRKARGLNAPEKSDAR